MAGEVPKWMEDAMWRRDIAELCRRARCSCCCEEHTSESCPARAWYGCRGQGNDTCAEQESWFRHYRDHHGMTEGQFYGWEVQ